MQSIRRYLLVRRLPLLLPVTLSAGLLLSADLVVQPSQAATRKTQFRKTQFRKAKSSSRIHKKQTASKPAKALPAKSPLDAPYLQVAPYVRVLAAPVDNPGFSASPIPVAAAPAPGAAPNAAPASDITTQEKIQITLPQTPGTTTLSREHYPNGATTPNGRVQWTQGISATPLLSRAEKVQKLIEGALNDSRVKVLVVEENGGLVAVVSGTVEPPPSLKPGELPKPRPLTREGILGIVGRFKTDNLIQAIYDDGLIEEKKTTTASLPSITTETWPLSFLSTTVSGAEEADKRFDVESMIKALHTRYGRTDTAKPEPGKPLITHSRHLLMMHGTKDDIYDIKRQLVFLDAAPPQVQMDMWAIQIAGKRGKDMDERLRKITVGTQEGRTYLLASQVLLANIISANTPEKKKGAGSYDPHLIQLLKDLSFNTNTNRPLSLTEMFVFTGMADASLRETIVDQWEAALTKLIHDSQFSSIPLEQRVLQPILQKTFSAVGKPVRLNRMRLQLRLYSSQTDPTKQRIEKETNAKIGQEGMKIFFEALKAYRETPDYSSYEGLIKKAADAKTLATKEKTDATALASEEAARQVKLASPEYLRRVAATGDQLLKTAADAFTADMNELFLLPLLRELQTGTASSGTKSSQGGIALVGQTRLVVSSGLETALTPKLESYVDTTRPKTLTPEALKKALEGTDPLSAALPGLNPEHLRLLSVLFAQPEEQITKIAPGLGINVRPTVMPDGNTARLQINMRVGVETSQEQPGTNVLTWKPADAVKEHKVTTDAIINGFDLFNISSFAITTSHPRPPKYVPILGTLPLIGRAFQRRRSDIQSDHHSMILVNAIILPRAMDVSRFYGD